MLPQIRTADIRQEFKSLLSAGKFTSVNREATMTSLTGDTTIEIVSASFIADEESIFGEVNWDYVKREEEWYNSMSLNINDIPGGPPQIWRAVADKDGYINSNYGWCIYSPENGFNKSVREVTSQYVRVRAELKTNPESRRAIMIYTRPSMWVDYHKNGRSDFMCTNSVQYLIRDGQLHAIVQMRSNDSIFGYRNDRAWQQHVLEKLAAELNIPAGNLYWNVGSLHIYARHYYLVDHFAKTGELNISKADYKKLYPDSPYLLV
jgi:thymidylate synthase